MKKMNVTSRKQWCIKWYDGKYNRTAAVYDSIEGAKIKTTFILFYEGGLLQAIEDVRGFTITYAHCLAYQYCDGSLNVIKD